MLAFKKRGQLIHVRMTKPLSDYFKFCEIIPKIAIPSNLRAKC